MQTGQGAAFAFRPARMAIDLVSVILYLVGITVYGIWVGRREAGTSEGYFLGGRKFGWFAIGAAVFATNSSITQFMSISGMAIKIGIASINNDLAAGPGLAPVKARLGKFAPAKWAKSLGGREG